MHLINVRWSVVDTLLSAVSTISNVQQALVVIALIAIITIVDSQFINVFYRTSWSDIIGEKAIGSE